jgi:hypothetical protein
MDNHFSISLKIVLKIDRTCVNHRRKIKSHTYRLNNTHHQSTTTTTTTTIDNNNNNNSSNNNNND